MMKKNSAQAKRGSLFFSRIFACFFCVDKQPKHRHLSKHKETGGKNDEKKFCTSKARKPFFQHAFRLFFLR